MPYPEIMIRPMREDLTRLGVEELKTADAVDETVKNSKGTLMVVVNSICGCAAGKARPGVALALQHNVKPDKVATVFAGADIEATERAIDGLCNGTARCATSFWSHDRPEQAMIIVSAAVVTNSSRIL